MTSEKKKRKGAKQESLAPSLRSTEKKKKR